MGYMMNRMKRKGLLIILMLALVFSLDGCLRNEEIKPETEVNQTGIERIPSPEEKNKANDTVSKTSESGYDLPNDDSESTVEDEKPEEPPEIIGTAGADGTVPVSRIVLDRYETVIHVGQIDMPWETIYPTNATDKSTYWRSSDERVASVDKYGRITAVSEGECIITVTSYSTTEVTTEFHVTVTPKPDITEPTYIDGVMIANKTYPLPETYNPGVDEEAYNALNVMISGAANDGITLTMISGFRSYERQQTLYSNYLLREGRDAADRYSARPGYSEHQTGLAFDLNSLEYSFDQTPEGQWLAEHCAEYGFIIRYPNNKEAETGYHYEPWHVRYLGKELAEKVTDSGLSLEEYLGITSVYAN